MDRHEIEARIGRILRERANVEVPTADTDLLESGALDSMTFVELLAQLEQEFGVPVDIAELELDDLRTIARIGAFVASALGAVRS